MCTTRLSVASALAVLGMLAAVSSAFPATRPTLSSVGSSAARQFTAPHPSCIAPSEDPLKTVRAWIETEAQGQPSRCRLTEPSYRGWEQPFAVVEHAWVTSYLHEPTRIAYVVLLANHKRVARYLLVIHKGRDAVWHVSAWAEL